MDTQSVSTPVIIATVILSILLFGFLGWRYINAPLRDAKGQDLSRAAVQPAKMSYGPRPVSAKGARPGKDAKQTH